MILRRPTTIERITCTQELRLLVGAEAGAPEGTVRAVQLLIPEGGDFHFSIDHPTDIEAGSDRAYWVPLVPGGQTIKFLLQRQQTIWGMVAAGTSEASAIIEYLDAPREVL